MTLKNAFQLMRTLVVAAAMISSLMIADVALAQDAHAPVSITILTSPSGSGPYNAFATIETHMQEFSPWLKLQVQETPGFNYNVKYMLRHPEKLKSTVFGTGTVLNWAAETGQKPFYPKPFPEMKDFRIVAVLGLSYDVWVTTHKNIRTPEDFVGKRVGIGLLTQNEWGMYQRMLLDGWDLRKKLATLDTLGTGANIDALLDGRTDVGTLFGLTSAEGKFTVVTGPHRKLEASHRNWHYVDVPAKMITDYNKRTGAPFRVVQYAPHTLPNQKAPLTTFGDLLLISAHKSMPDDVVYELVRTLIKNYPQIAKYNAFTRAWTPATLAYGAKQHPEEFHPGALKAFKEFGLM